MFFMNNVPSDPDSVTQKLLGNLQAIAIEVD
jgi:hypothetical protein